VPEQQPVVVVGAGPGVGAATARRFGAAGYPVALFSRSSATTAGAAAELSAMTAELAPDGIAEAHYRLHEQAPANWEVEALFSGG
jgi:NAD(P)-dependent dehydrogenase (short-subunit alcohol dehydrogenase family)